MVPSTQFQHLPASSLDQSHLSNHHRSASSDTKLEPPPFANRHVIRSLRLNATRPDRSIDPRLVALETSARAPQRGNTRIRFESWTETEDSFQHSI